MLSAGGALLDPCDCLKKEQFVYATVKMVDGPSLALSGVVVGLDSGGPLVQWIYTTENEAGKVDAVLRQHLQPASASSASSASSGGAALSPQSSKPARDATAARAAPPRSGDSPAPTSTRRRRPAGQRTRRALKPPTAKTSPTKPAAQLPEKAIEGAPGGVVISGNKVDVDATLRQRARTVRSSDLASRLQTVQVLNTRVIKQLIKDAVDEAVVLLGPTLGERERKRLLEEAEATFREKMRIYESEKAGLEEKTRLLQEELKKATSVLEEERDRVVSADRFILSDSGMVQLEQRLGRVLDSAIKRGQAGPQVEEELRGMVARLLDDERDRIRQKEEQAQSDKISLLQKKVQRLASSLDVAEKERDRARRRAQILEASGGVPLRNVVEAGIDEDDPDRERKMTLLKEIFEFNKEIRRELEASGRLPGRPPGSGTARQGEGSAPEGSPGGNIQPEAESTDAGPGEMAEEPQQGAAGLPDSREERAIASSLGIRVQSGVDHVRDPSAGGHGEHGRDTEVIRVTDPGGPPLEELPAVGAVEETPETEVVRDPDDELWEASEDPEADLARWTTVRSLGG